MLSRSLDIPSCSHSFFCIVDNMDFLQSSLPQHIHSIGICDYRSPGEIDPCVNHLEKIHIGKSIGETTLRHFSMFSPTRMRESSREMARNLLRDPPHFPSHDSPCTSPHLASLCSSPSPLPSSPPSCFWPPPSAGTTASGTPNQLFGTSPHNT